MAMVLRDVGIMNMNADMWTKAIRPKVGTWNLHRHLPSNLDFFVNFSSMAGLFGYFGQANYASANTLKPAYSTGTLTDKPPRSLISAPSTMSDTWLVLRDPSAVLPRIQASSASRSSWIVCNWLCCPNLRQRDEDMRSKAVTAIRARLARCHSAPCQSQILRTPHCGSATGAWPSTVISRKYPLLRAKARHRTLCERLSTR